MGTLPGSVVLATRNAHKLRELARLMQGTGTELQPLPEDVRLPPEDGNSFQANALPKARAAATALGRCAIADDSGIEAAALGGLPGVRSARYAGERASDEENLAKLTARVPAGSPLRYVCALAYVDPQAGLERVFFGECRGRMAPRRRGRGGFGYDPVFLVQGDPRGRTMAQLSDSEKDAVSHRGAAARALAAFLAAQRG